MPRSDTPFVASLEQANRLPTPWGSPFVDEDGAPATSEPFHDALWAEEELDASWDDQPLEEAWGDEPLETEWDEEQLAAALDEEVLDLPPAGESFSLDLFEAPAASPVDVEVEHEDGARSRRERVVGDPLGQRFHDLLWRRMPAGDDAAIKARRDELLVLIAGLARADAAALLPRIRRGGDLAADLEERLSQALGERIRQLIAVRAAGGGGPSAVRVGPAPAVPGAPLDEQQKQLLNVAVGTTIPLASIRVFTRKIGRTLIYVEGSGELTIKLLQPEPATFNAYVKLGETGINELKVKIADGLFGAESSIAFAPGKEGGGDFKLTIGGAGIELELSPNPLKPVSLNLPIIERKPISLERQLKALGLRGEAVVTLKLEVQVIPDYAAVASVARTLAANSARAARDLVRGAARAVTRVKFGGRLAVRVGRAVWTSVMTRALRPAGRAMAQEWARLVMRHGAKATMGVAAARAAGKYAGPAIGAVLLWWEAGSLALQRLDEHTNAQVGREKAALAKQFRSGYASTLSKLVEPDWRDTFEGLVQETLRHTWTRFSAPFPHAYRAYETFRVPLAQQGELQAWLAGPARRLTAARDVNLATLAWEELLADAVRAAVFARRFLGGKDDATIMNVRLAARGEALMCGAAAAFQDVLNFIGANTADPTVTSGSPVDGVQQWNAVAELFRIGYGPVHIERVRAFEPLVNPDGVDLFPFAE